jgi:hypothetical protein
MKLRFSIIALGALCCLFSGCGCSKEKKADDAVLPRMEDPAYTNQLVQLRGDKAAVANKLAALKKKIDDLGKEAVGTAEYIGLTNQLAQCEKEADSLRKKTLNAVRERIMKESAQKGNQKE